MLTSVLFVAKPTSNFSKFVVCPHTWTGRRGRQGIEPVLTFFGQGEVNFS